MRCETKFFAFANECKIFYFMFCRMYKILMRLFKKMKKKNHNYVFRLIFWSTYRHSKITSRYIVCDSYITRIISFTRLRVSPNLHLPGITHFQSLYRNIVWQYLCTNKMNKQNKNTIFCSIIVSVQTYNFPTRVY